MKTTSRVIAPANGVRLDSIGEVPTIVELGMTVRDKSLEGTSALALSIKEKLQPAVTFVVN